MYRGAHARPQPPIARHIAIPEPGDVGQMIVRGATNFARRHKVISGSYILGILVILLVGSGTKLTYDQRREYNSIMNTIDLHAESNAYFDFYKAREAYRDSKGWFWRCDSTCQRQQRLMEKAQYNLDKILKEGEARQSDAKAVAGLFSEIGVGEVQDSFWSYFNNGKQFAKRQSMWDALFMGFRSMSRDEPFIEYALKMLINVLVNFSLGLLMALLFFVVGLWSIVRSYQPSPIVAVLFFIGAACAAFAFVTTYLLAIYGAAAGSVYGVLKVAESNTRAQIGGRQQRQYMNNRPHYE